MSASSKTARVRRLAMETAAVTPWEVGLRLTPAFNGRIPPTFAHIAPRHRRRRRESALIGIIDLRLPVTVMLVLFSACWGWSATAPSGFGPEISVPRDLPREEQWQRPARNWIDQ